MGQGGEREGSHETSGRRSQSGTGKRSRSREELSDSSDDFAACLPWVRDPIPADGHRSNPWNNASPPSREPSTRGWLLRRKSNAQTSHPSQPSNANDSRGHHYRESEVHGHRQASRSDRCRRNHRRRVRQDVRRTIFPRVTPGHPASTRPRTTCPPPDPQITLQPLHRRISHQRRIARGATRHQRSMPSG